MLCFGWIVENKMCWLEYYMLFVMCDDSICYVHCLLLMKHDVVQLVDNSHELNYGDMLE